MEIYEVIERPKLNTKDGKPALIDNIIGRKDHYITGVDFNCQYSASEHKMYFVQNEESFSIIEYISNDMGKSWFETNFFTGLDHVPEEIVKLLDSWLDVEHNKPTTYLKGDWDGSKSNYVLVKSVDGVPGVAVLYEGYLDGTKFSSWYSVDFDGTEGYEITPKYWKKIK